MPDKKKSRGTKRGPAADTLSPLIAEVRRLIQSARHAAASTVNTLQVLRLVAASWSTNRKARRQSWELPPTIWLSITMQTNSIGLR